ncbi:MAG: acyl-CoA synthetase [Stackebrandtia sp.]
MNSLFPALWTGETTVALRFGDRALDYPQLAAAATSLAGRLTAASRLALWAEPTLETAVATVAALLAGVPVVPVNPKIGERELAHIVTDSAPDLVLAAPGSRLPGPLQALPRTDITIDTSVPAAPLPETADDADALIVYTSGTTGPPKGAVLPRRSITTTLDGLAEVWDWTASDVVVHGLPLFHVHGLVLGTLGPLRRGGTAHHLGRFSPAAVAEALAGEGTVLFAVPTMYHRLAEAVGSEAGLSEALSGARLLVSGSAALSLPDHERLAAATGKRVVERYGMTETLMNTSIRPDGPAKPGCVGLPLPDVELRLVDENGEVITESDGETIGEIQVRGPNLFIRYLNRPEATAAAFTEAWFRTGDMATKDADGDIRIVGRQSTDLIKSGGFKIGAGEIENALLDHPEVAEAAVTGEPDDDLGERVVAWIVPSDPERPPSTETLAEHVAAKLAPHKRPRAVHFRTSLPRNDMGKLMKRELK